MTNDIKVIRTTIPKEKPDQSNLGFGRYFTDHMFVTDYSTEKGWHDPRIEPYAPITLDPSAMVFHYGQTIFEGLKAYKTKEGKVKLFRPEMNMKRINVTNDRMCIPPIDVDFCVQACKKVVEVDKDWIPDEPGTSLYIRPFIIATDPYLGVRPSNTYKFFIILCPVGAYYPEGLDPVKIYVEPYYVRAVKGGTGFAKTGGNYAASLKAQMEAMEKGYTQVLWLDGLEKKYVEEVGTMNVFFKIDGEIYTCVLDGSVLPGVTRDSAIRVLKDWGYKVNETRFTIQEIYDAHASGKLEEVFGTGTAAVISPVGELNWNGNIISINKGKIGELSQRLYDMITGIQTGQLEDPYGWTIEI